MDAPRTVASKLTRTLDLPPSCMQFCPRHPSYFVVGTYSLEESDAAGRGEADEPIEEQLAAAGNGQVRHGTLVVFRLEGEVLTKVQTVLQPSALLDVRFHPQHGAILAAVSSTGTLAVFTLDPGRSATEPLRQLATSKCPDLTEDTLFLQCAWHPTLERVMAVTTSGGLSRLLFLDDGWRIRHHLDLEMANSLEAWSIAFSPPTTGPDESTQSASVYGGGDDSLLRYGLCSWAADAADASPTITMPHVPLAVKNQHGAGVTAILPLPLRSADGGRIVLTGSYDDHLRVFVIHDLDASGGARRVRLAAEKKLGGGVWRLGLVRVSSSEPDAPSTVRILASCMHAGVRLVDVESHDGLEWTCTVLARFEEHRSMNYASDCVVVDDGGSERLLCVSTSFYDKLLCVWEYPELDDAARSVPA
ncbi:hypothetical protein RJ55_01949 [Drechmeria coniospora]|nr:hypothetical protein RJ55_01949 [Drechmeria coniospora]